MVRLPGQVVYTVLQCLANLAIPGLWEVDVRYLRPVNFLKVPLDF